MSGKEVNSEDLSEQRIKRLTNWLKKPENIVLAGILIFSFVLRVYFLVQTSDQALWWDEGEYMSHAKEMAFGTPYNENPQRPPLFQFLASLFFMVNLGEMSIRCFLVLIPSVFLVFATYLLGRKMYNEKIGLIAAFLTSVSWTYLFWTARVQPDFLSMSFQVLSIFFMWQYWDDKKSWPIILSGIFAALGFHFKISGLLVPMIFIPFILIKEKFSAFKNKNYYYFSLAFLLTLVPYFLWSYLTFNTPTAFTAGYIQPVAETVPFGWYNLEFYYKLTGGLSFVLFLVGVVLALEFLLYFGLKVTKQERSLNADVFCLIVFLVVSAFYIFHIKNTDDRWVFLWLPFIFMLIGKSVTFISDKTRKIHRLLPVLILLVLLSFVGYAQINQAKDIIEIKKESYMPVKLAGLWIKENSLSTDKVLSISYTQSVYYTERNVSSYSEINGTEEFDEYLKENEPTFLQVSIFEPHPSWIFDWTQTNQQRLAPMQAYFADAENTQPVLVIYRIDYSNEEN